MVRRLGVLAVRPAIMTLVRVDMLCALALVVCVSFPSGAEAAGRSRRNCPVGYDGKPLITGPAECLDGFQRDLLGIGPETGELKRHQRAADELLRKHGPRTVAARSCTPVDNSARILRSPNPNDLHPDWKGEAYVGLSWSLRVTGSSVRSDTGSYLRGDLVSPRGGVINKGVYVVAREWECRG